MQKCRYLIGSTADINAYAGIFQNVDAAAIIARIRVEQGNHDPLDAAARQHLCTRGCASGKRAGLESNVGRHFRQRALILLHGLHFGVVASNGLGVTLRHYFAIFDQNTTDGWVGMAGWQCLA